MLNLNTICCFCCRWCGWMRYCFCLPKLRKWNKGGNSGSARRRGGGGGRGASRCPQPAFPPLFRDQPVSRTSVIFFLKTVFFPNQWRIHGGAPVIFSPNWGPQKNLICAPPPPPPPLIWKSGSATARQYPCGDFGESHFPSGVLIRDLENILSDPGNSIS